MPNNNFARFRELVLEDSALQAKLRSIADHESFIAQVLELGREHGYEFSRDDVSKAISTGRRTWLERWI